LRRPCGKGPRRHASRPAAPGSAPRGGDAQAVGYRGRGHLLQPQERAGALQPERDGGQGSLD
ncbi:unnamed protein product, partial [Ectocarpus fasciculatus]